MQMIKKIFLLSFIFISVCNAAGVRTAVEGEQLQIYRDEALFILVSSGNITGGNLDRIKLLVANGARTDRGIYAGESVLWLERISTVDSVIAGFKRSYKNEDDVAALIRAVYPSK
jgi:hypothetical protein